MEQDTDFGQKIPAEPVPEPEVKEPTIEDKLEQAVKQAEEAAARADKAEKSVQGLRGSLQEKENKLREQAGSNTRMDGIEQRMEIIALALDKGLSVGEIDGEKLNLKQEFAELKAKQDKVRDDDRNKTAYDEYVQKGNAIYTEAEELFGDDIDKLHDIRNLIRANDLDLAEKKIAKARGTSEPKKETNVPTVEEQVTERLRQEMEKRGLLRSDNGAPAGETTNDDKIKENYRKNPNNKANRDAYLELQRKIRGS